MPHPTMTTTTLESMPTEVPILGAGVPKLKRPSPILTTQSSGSHIPGADPMTIQTQEVFSVGKKTHPILEMSKIIPKNFA